MRLRHLLLIFSLVVTERVNACVCFPIDSISAIELMKEVEFVIIGHAVKNIGSNVELNRMWDKGNRGYNVLIEIDSVLKGNLDSKTIVVHQFGGNCDQNFEFGEQYLIVGNKLEQFVNGTPKKKKTNKREIPLSSMPPPPPSLYSKTAIFYDSSDDEIKYWNELANEKIIINTSMCSSFYATSKIASYFLNY